LTEGSSKPSSSSADADTLEIAPGFKRQVVEGWVPNLASENDIHDALEKAFDYRGDVTITCRDGTRVEGYVFDRRRGSSLNNSFVRLIPKNSAEKIAIAYADIAALAFTGRDTAAGKSWEAWVRRYWEKRAAGETRIALEPESLDS
jgi:transcriptional antiterminator Rof (Rho-off)